MFRRQQSQAALHDDLHDAQKPMQLHSSAYVATWLGFLISAKTRLIAHPRAMSASSSISWMMWSAPRSSPMAASTDASALQEDVHRPAHVSTCSLCLQRVAAP